jgi:hypothetical protein
MAGQQPIRDLQREASPPGAFPETPAAEKDAPLEKDAPATAGADQSVSVNPIPATGGIGNPINLKPGEAVPSPETLTGNTLTSNVKLDEESYNKPDASAPELPAAQSNTSEKEAAGAGAILGGAGPQMTNMIPESSMGMGKDAQIGSDAGPTISSVGPQSTTAQLAGQQPIESNRAPEVVQESQKEAGVDPEASANPTAVQEKSEVEKELEQKVPEQPATTDSAAPDTKESDNKGVYGAAAGGAAALGAAAAGAAYMANDKVKESTGKDAVGALPQSVQDSINSMNNKGSSTTAPVEQASAGAATTDSTLPQQTAAGEPVKVPAAEGSARDVADSVPQEVIASQKEAHVDPEAAANPEAVHEKSAVENELLKKVPESEAAGEPAPETASAAALSPTAPSTSAAAPTSASGAPQLSDPTAGVAALSMDDKPAAGSKDLNAPATDPAVPPTQNPTGLTTPDANPAAERSRDVSPMTRPDGSSATPAVTTGIDSAAAPATSGKPVGSRPAAGKENSTPTKRQSFVDRLKGTPDSTKSTGSSGTEGEGGKKKKGFLKRLAEKLK